MISYSSESSRALYSECSKKWEFKYIQRIPQKPKLALQVGILQHLIIRRVNECYKQYGKYPTEKSLKELIAFLAKDLLNELLFVDYKRGSEAEKKMPLTEYFETQKVKILEQLTALTSLYIDKAKESFADLLYIENEHKIKIGEKEHTTIIDLIALHVDGTIRVIDYKTRQKSGGDLAILQLIGYGMAASDLLKRPIDRLEQWDLIRKKNPEIEVQEVDMSQFNDLAGVLTEELEVFWRGVESKTFTRNLRSMSCGEDKCEYWDICMRPSKIRELKAEAEAEFKDDSIIGLEEVRR